MLLVLEQPIKNKIAGKPQNKMNRINSVDMKVKKRTKEQKTEEKNGKHSNTTNNKMVDSNSIITLNINELNTQLKGRDYILINKSQLCLFQEIHFKF